MTAPVAFTRTTYADDDTLDAAAFNAQSAASATVRSATNLLEGVVQMTGDLAGTGAAPVIASNAVTFAKMQDIATLKVIGRQTAGTGDPEELTCTAAGAALLAAANAAAQLALLTSGGTATESNTTTSKGVSKTDAAVPISGGVSHLLFDTANAPTITLTAGTWLVTGSLAVSTTFTSPTYVEFYNVTDGVGFGSSAAVVGTGANTTFVGPVSVSGTITVASGSKTIQFKAHTTNANGANLGTIILGNSSSFAPAGYIVAQLLLAP